MFPTGLTLATSQEWPRNIVRNACRLTMTCSMLLPVWRQCWTSLFLRGSTTVCQRWFSMLLCCGNRSGKSEIYPNSGGHRHHPFRAGHGWVGRAQSGLRSGTFLQRIFTKIHRSATSMSWSHYFSGGKWALKGKHWSWSSISTSLSSHASMPPGWNSISYQSASSSCRDYVKYSHPLSPDKIYPYPFPFPDGAEAGSPDNKYGPILRCIANGGWLLKSNKLEQHDWIFEIYGIFNLRVDDELGLGY